MIQNILQEPPQIDPSIQHPAREFILECLEKDHTKRPNANYLYDKVDEVLPNKTIQTLQQVDISCFMVMTKTVIELLK